MTTLNLFPEYIRENANVMAFSKVMDYLFTDSTYVSGSVSLPSGHTHVPLFDSAEYVNIFKQIEDGEASIRVMDEFAKQFNVAAYEHADCYSSDASVIRGIKESLLRNGIYLSRIKGTPRSIELVLQKFNYIDITITENVYVGLQYDGFYSYNGFVGYFGNYETFLFDVYLEATHETDQGEIDAIVSIINSYKKLTSVLYQLTVKDTIGTIVYNIYTP